MTGRGMLAAGVLLLVSQTLTARPWQAGVALGVLLAVAGMARLMDGEGRSRPR